MPSALGPAQRSRSIACLQLPFGSCMASGSGSRGPRGCGQAGQETPSAHLKRARGGSGWPYEGHPLGPAPGQLPRSCPAALLQGAPVCDWLPGEPAVRGPGAGADTHFQWGCGREAGEKLGRGLGTRAKPPAPILSGREGGSGWPSDGRPLGPAPGSLAAKGHLSATGSHFGVLPAVRRWLATT